VALIGLFLLIATINDVRTLKIPNKINIAFLISRIIAIPILGLEFSHILGGVIGFLILLIPAMLTMHKMGGDIKMMTILGLFLGMYLTPIFIGLSCFCGFIFGILQNIIFKKSLNMSFAFAPMFFITHVILFFIVLAI
jgi:Flp pilus assembly protein protease CpaA